VSRSKLIRHLSLFLLRILSQIVVLVGGLVFFYGSYRFSEGPIVAQYGGYYNVGDSGLQPRSFEEYHAFKRWEIAIFVLWPAMFALCGLRYWLDPRGRVWFWGWEQMSRNNLTKRSS
jgi:hypothetical protein